MTRRSFFGLVGALFVPKKPNWHRKAPFVYYNKNTLKYLGTKFRLLSHTEDGFIDSGKGKTFYFSKIYANEAL